jgi:hypothetical protein
LSSITGLFVGAHVLLAERANIPELALSMDEGQTFMKAAQNVMRHYSVQTTQKTMDWISFAGVTCMIYVPRVVAIANRAKQKPIDNVVRFAPAGTATPGHSYDAPPGSPLEGAFAMSAVQPEHE